MSEEQSNAALQFWYPVSWELFDYASNYTFPKCTQEHNVAGNSASPTLLILCISIPAQSSYIHRTVIKRCSLLLCCPDWDPPSVLTFVGPCIVIYFYSKTNWLHNIANLFYFGATFYMFRTVSPSIIGSLRLYTQHHTIQVMWLLASKQPHNLYDIHLMLYVQS